MENLVAVFALVGVLGIGAQWLAWRLKLPAIVLMLAAGVLAGPAAGLLDPAAQFGDLLRPVVGAAVALILFEGGLTLDLGGLRDARPAVRRLAVLGAPLAWLFSTLAARYVAGLSWEVSAVFGGILVVTGPTVVTPLLRQARLAARPASVLRWEAIVNDPIGALAAVVAFEIAAALAEQGGLAEALGHVALGIAVAGAVGWAAGRGLTLMFRRGLTPEYLKAPGMIAAVVAVYAACDGVLHESGLLAVTVMGMTMANARLPSLGELRRFKEAVTILLVSGVFVILAATLDAEMLARLDWRAALFVAAIMLVARPLAVSLALIGAGLERREVAIVAWIGPRGVVAVAVSGFFAGRLAEIGVADAEALAPLAFALVAATVVAHGFSIGPVARALGLSESGPPAVLIAGASPWTAALAGVLAKAEVPVLIADDQWWRLRAPREAGTEVFYGEILSEAAEHAIEPGRFGHLIAATGNDAYNSLVCTALAPEIGRSEVYQTGRDELAEAEGGDPGRGLHATLGGRSFAVGADHHAYARRLAEGWRFSRTPLTAEYGLDAWAEARPGAELIALQGASGALRFATPGRRMSGKGAAAAIGFVPPAEADDGG